MTTIALPSPADLPAARAVTRRLRIGVVCHAGDRGRSGIGQYLVNVVRRLPAVEPRHQYVLFVPGRDAGMWDGLGERARVVLQPDLMDAPWRSMIWHLTRLRGDLKRHGCDVVFLPSGNRRLGMAYGIPSVATVHDLSQVHVPGKYDFLHTLHARRLMPFLMRRQTRLICVSDNTRSDVLQHAQAAPNRVSVVHNGADLHRFQATRPASGIRLAQRFGLRDPYILYVARLEHPGKNHVRLIEAFARLVAGGNQTHRLVFCGPDWSGSEAIHAAINRHGLAGRVVLTGFVDAEELPDLYQGADVFVFPSLYEGFGIPLVEAMASGTPACVADRGSLPEVAAGAALLFNPEDPAEMSRALQRLLSDRGLRERCIELGRRRAAGFNWDRCATDVVRQIESACERQD